MNKQTMIASLFSSSLAYMPHGHCYLWQTPLVSLHVTSDALIALAYFSIPIILVYSVYKRQDVPFLNIFILFSAFIILCGIGHLLEVWTLWYPNYWISGIEQAATALVSCYTATAMVTLIPQFLSLKTSEELALINHQLQEEIKLRQQAENELRITNGNLEQRVQERIQELNQINQHLAAEIEARTRIESALRDSEKKEREKADNLEQMLGQLKNTQSQLVQSEKMAALGKMVGGIAHEINNPITFIYSNIESSFQYVHDLLNLIGLYQLYYPEPVPVITNQIESLDLEFIQEDFLQLLDSMKTGADRIKKIVLSLRNFSRLDEQGCKLIDLNAAIENTLSLLSNSLLPLSATGAIEVIQKFDEIPPVECYPGQLNQALVNILENAIDAVVERQKVEPDFTGEIQIETKRDSHDRVVILIQDNGLGIPDEIRSKIFDPFFSTKPIGQGTGLGLTTAYQIIVQEHHGEFECTSNPGMGTCFKIDLPLSCAA
ncbi:sensor histidine kinase [Roseofilum sp. SID2]|uniref:sensor histidine kinase n=3 Tax=unclassified Roseofilum TaxID=2620099 RepID=UPI00298E2656|nr:ATP-binding protein [Roseofilum sp. SID2]